MGKFICATYLLPIKVAGLGFRAEIKSLSSRAEKRGEEARWSASKSALLQQTLTGLLEASIKPWAVAFTYPLTFSVFTSFSPSDTGKNVGQENGHVPSLFWVAGGTPCQVWVCGFMQEKIQDQATVELR